MPIAIIGLFGAACLVFAFPFGDPFQTPKTLGLLLLLALMWRPCTRPPESRLLPALFGWLVLTGFWALNPLAFFEALTLPALALLALSIRQSQLETDRRALATGLLAAGLIAAIYAWVQVLGWDFVEYREGGRAFSFFGNTNTTAEFLLLALVLGEFPLGRWRLPFKWFLISGILICESKGVWIALLILALVQIKSWPTRRRWFALAVFAISGLALGWVFRGDLNRGAAYFCAPQDYVAEYRVQPETADQRDVWFRGKRRSLMTRLFLFGNTAAMVADHPLFGVGLGQFPVFYPAYGAAVWPDINLDGKYRAESPHNLPLEAAAELGLPWMLLALWLGFRFWRHCAPGSFRTALGLQLFIALFSTNYLNPVLVCSLILFCPKVPMTESEPGPGLGARRLWQWASWVLQILAVLIVLASIYADFQRGHASRQTRIEEVHPWFDGDRARLAYADDDLDRAWREQLSVWKYDPYGPETLINLGNIAWSLAASQAEAEDTREWRGLALDAYHLVHTMFPDYRPVARRLSGLQRQGVLPADFFSRERGRPATERANLARRIAARRIAARESASQQITEPR